MTLQHTVLQNYCHYFTSVTHKGMKTQDLLGEQTLYLLSGAPLEEPPSCSVFSSCTSTCHSTILVIHLCICINNIRL